MRWRCVGGCRWRRRSTRWPSGGTTSPNSPGGWYIVGGRRGWIGPRGTGSRRDSVRRCYRGWEPRGGASWGGGWRYKTTPLPALGAWKSAAELAGVTLEQFVMDALHITPYERDTVAGLGLVGNRGGGAGGGGACWGGEVNHTCAGA